MLKMLQRLHCEDQDLPTVNEEQPVVVLTDTTAEVRRE
jgi:DNA-directed RNA polymerase subunit H (RpoH/RPB5)